MEDKFEKDLADAMQSDIEITETVRKSLDDTYSIIRKKKRSRNLLFNRRWIAAAVCSALLTIALLSNETVRAVIKPFFNFGDKGIERAVDEEMLQQNKSSATDQNIRVTLDNLAYDSNKLGLSFKLKFEDKKILKGDIQKVGIEYRIKNGNGDYIIEVVNDDKQLKGKNNIKYSLTEDNSFLDFKNGDVRCNFLFESSKGRIPGLENAVIEVESVIIFYKKGSLKKIDGSWNLSIDNNKQTKDKDVEYAAASNTSKVNILSAKATSTSFNISFALDITSGTGRSLEIQEMKLIGEKGEVYKCSVYNKEVKRFNNIIN